jgi:cytochrome P450
MDTTGELISSSLIMFSKHPEMVEKFREEADKFVKEGDYSI